VAKRSVGKADVPGAKAAYRRLGDDGRAAAEVLRPWGEPAPDGTHRPLQTVVVRAGDVVGGLDLPAAREHHRAAKAELSSVALEPGDPLPTVLPEETTVTDRYDARPPSWWSTSRTTSPTPPAASTSPAASRWCPSLNAEAAAAADAGAVVVCTQDWHPERTPHFAKDGGTWPVHCVGGTWGSELHPDLRAPGERVRKGTGGEDGYSGFTVRDPVSGAQTPTALEPLLRDRGVERVVVVGIATDYCVLETALDAARLGFATTVLTDASARWTGAGDGERALANGAGGVVWPDGRRSGSHGEHPHRRRPWRTGNPQEQPVRTPTSRRGGHRRRRPPRQHCPRAPGHHRSTR
jgi:nicotinamidase/pyrazinamidase